MRLFLPLTLTEQFEFIKRSEIFQLCLATKQKQKIIKCCSVAKLRFGKVIAKIFTCSSNVVYKRFGDDSFLKGNKHDQAPRKRRVNELEMKDFMDEWSQTAFVTFTELTFSCRAKIDNKHSSNKIEPTFVVFPLFLEPREFVTIDKMKGFLKVLIQVFQIDRYLHRWAAP